jgi:putative ABC transport system substrate-binding protein
MDAFREGLAALGWVEGRNVVIDARHIDPPYDRLAAVASELVDLKPDVIVTHGPGAWPPSGRRR